MSSFWCQWAWLGGDTATADVLLETVGGVITGVNPGVACPDDAVRLAGVTLPGLANAHSHAFHRVLRGRTQVGVGSFWTWREQMYLAAARLDPDSYHRLARAVYGEMVLAGITCVGEFHYLHHGPGGIPYDAPNAMGDALVAAAKDAGVRLTLLDTCYLHGGIGADRRHLPPNEVQQRFSDGDASSWASRATSSLTLESPTCRIGAAVHSVRAVDPASMHVVATWAAEHDAQVHAHVSEQQVENELCVDAYGLTPVALLAERGVLGPNFSAVHATHLSGIDIELLGSAHCTVCMCPTTERDLADGIGPAMALRDLGARLSLGSDSHAVVDMFEEARALELDERLGSLVRGSHDAPSLLRAATIGGHASLGWPEAGVLGVGALADLVTVRLDSVRTAGATDASMLETVVFAATAADVHHVVVDGELVVNDGAHRSLDVAHELHSAIIDVMSD